MSTPPRPNPSVPTTHLDPATPSGFQTPRQQAPAPKPTTWAGTDSPSGFQAPRREPTNEEIALVESGAHRAPVPAETAKRRRRPRGIIAGVAAAPVFGGIGYYAASPEQASTGGWAAEGITAVVIDNEVGDFTIKESSDSTVRFSEDLRYRGTKRTTEHRVDGGTLHIDTGGRGGVHSSGVGNDRLDYVVEVPKGATITYKQSAGKLALDGHYGAVSIDMSAGRLESRELVAPSVRIKMSAGNISVAKLDVDDVDIRQSAGNTDLRFATAPDKLSLDVSAGNVDADVPDGTYEVTKQVSAGNVEVKVPTGTSDHDIAIKVSAGNVTVR